MKAYVGFDDASGTIRIWRNGGLCDEAETWEQLCDRPSVKNVSGLTVEAGADTAARADLVLHVCQWRFSREPGSDLASEIRLCQRPCPGDIQMRLERMWLSDTMYDLQLRTFPVTTADLSNYHFLASWKRGWTPEAIKAIRRHPAYLAYRFMVADGADPGDELAFARFVAEIEDPKWYISTRRFSRWSKALYRFRLLPTQKSHRRTRIAMSAWRNNISNVTSFFARYRDASFRQVLDEDYSVIMTTAKFLQFVLWIWREEQLKAYGSPDLFAPDYFFADTAAEAQFRRLRG